MSSGSGSGSTDPAYADFDPGNYKYLPYVYLGLSVVYTVMTIVWFIVTFRFRKVCENNFKNFSKKYIYNGSCCWFQVSKYSPLFPHFQVIFRVLNFSKDYFFCSTFGEKGKPQSCGSIFTTLHATAGIFDEVFLYFILSLVLRKLKLNSSHRFPMVII
jgi:hypothetical protein